MSDVPRSLQSWVSTIQSVVLTADVFHFFYKDRRPNLDPSPISSDGRKKKHFTRVQGFWEKSVGRRGQRLAPYENTTDPPDIFGAVIYIYWPCTTRGELAVGWFYVEIKGLLSCELFLISVFFDYFPCESTSSAAEYFQPISFLNSLGRKLCNIAFPLPSF